MSETTRTPQSLKDHFLVASPWLGDPHFHGSIVYICDHTADGAFGIMVNQPLDVSLGEILEQLDMEGGNLEVPVYSGGPVQQERGFVLHPPVGEWQSSSLLSDQLQITTSRDILQAIGDDAGPEQYLVTLGYSGWTDGQLEEELAGNAWLICPASASVLFDTRWEDRYSAVLALMGIDLSQLDQSVGHA